MIMLMFMVFNGALGSYPDITVTGKINIPGYKIECDPTDKPLVIEFLTDDRTECAIRKPNGSCSSFYFEHINDRKVLLVSRKEPYQDQTFGCEMIFEHTNKYLKVHCSVKFNGTDFVQIPKQITHIADFSYVGNVNTDTTSQGQTLVIIVVIASISLFAIEAIVCVMYIKKSKLESTRTSRTRQRKAMLNEL